jgi:hypothetical protein
MSDGGWTLGLLTLTLIFGGAAAFAWAVKRRMNARPVRVSPAIPFTIERSAPDMRAVLQRQAREAEERAKARGHEYRLEQFIEAFARRLMERWAGLTHEEARKHAHDCLNAYDMRFPDPEYDWSGTAARELADSYADENGEHYGANG